ncbi:MAG: TetR/AcrR family transcriptional regulator [Coriobacteriia bacterium]
MARETTGAPTKHSVKMTAGVMPKHRASRRARVSKDPEVRREEILAKAFELFMAQGFDETSVKDITDAVGVAKGLFYHYFESKADALNAAVEAQAAELIESLPKHADEMSGDALDKMRQVLGRVVTWKVDEHLDLIVAYSRVLYRPENLLLRTKMTQANADLFVPLFAEIIREGVKEGLCDVEDPVIASENVFAMWFGNSERIGQMWLRMLDDESLVEPLLARLRGWETGMERLLGIEPGALRIYDYDALRRTFTRLARGGIEAEARQRARRKGEGR